MTDIMDELEIAVNKAMKAYAQPEKVRGQYLKLIKNLIEGNEDSADLDRMIEGVVVKDIEEGTQ